MRGPMTGSARAASTSACSCEPDVGVGGVAEEEEVEGLAVAAGVDVAHHGAGGAEDAGPDPRCRSASAARCAGAARPGRFAWVPAPRKKPISGERAPKEIQAMLMTKRPSITFSTPVSPPTESTSHIWCDEEPVSRSAVSDEADPARGAPRVSPWSRRGARGRRCASDCSGIASGASGGSAAPRRSGSRRASGQLLHR